MLVVDDELLIEPVVSGVPVVLVFRFVVLVVEPLVVLLLVFVVEVVPLVWP